MRFLYTVPLTWSILCAGVLVPTLDAARMGGKGRE